MVGSDQSKINSRTGMINYSEFLISSGRSLLGRALLVHSREVVPDLSTASAEPLVRGC